LAKERIFGRKSYFKKFYYALLEQTLFEPNHGAILKRHAQELKPGKNGWKKSFADSLAFLSQKNAMIHL
jgi:hypothetical protein